MIGKRTVQTIVGWIIVGGHFSIILYILVGARDGWDANIKQSAILTMSPVTLTYLVAIVRAWVAGQSETGPGQPVNFNFAAITVIIPVLLLLFLGYTIVSFPREGFVHSEELQKWIALTEVMFGGTVGFVIGDLFPSSPSSGVRS